MRDLLKLFDRRYSAVNASDGNFPTNTNNNNTDEDNLQYLQQIDFNHRRRKKSLQASRSIRRGFTVVDSFFNQQKNGRRHPKCKFFYYKVFVFEIKIINAMKSNKPAQKSNKPLNKELKYVQMK